MKPARPPLQHGMGMVTAIIVLVMLAGIAAAVTRLSWTQQITSSEDLQGARAYQAAYAGTEWGMYQALKGSWQGSGCAGSQTLDLRSTNGFRVTVSCSVASYLEGQDASGNDVTLQIFTIEAVACNGTAATCPDDAQSTTLNYVERRRKSVVTNTSSS